MTPKGWWREWQDWVIFSMLAVIAVVFIVLFAMFSCSPTFTDTTPEEVDEEGPPIEMQDQIKMPPVHPGTLLCTRTLWQHVYHPWRLRVLNPCVSVSGTVAYVRSERDGDVHLGLRLDTPLQGAGAVLVVEIICQHSTSVAAAQAACSGYHNTIQVPAVGEHLTAIGPQVYDTDHGWPEIHPVNTLRR